MQLKSADLSLPRSVTSPSSKATADRRQTARSSLNCRRPPGVSDQSVHSDLRPLPSTRHFPLHGFRSKLRLTSIAFSFLFPFGTGQLNRFGPVSRSRPAALMPLCPNFSPLSCVHEGGSRMVNLRVTGAGGGRARICATTPETGAHFGIREFSL